MYYNFLQKYKKSVFQILSFPLRISSVHAIKSAENCGSCYNSFTILDKIFADFYNFLSPQQKQNCHPLHNNLNMLSNIRNVVYKLPYELPDNLKAKKFEK